MSEEEGKAPLQEKTVEEKIDEAIAQLEKKDKEAAAFMRQYLYTINVQRYGLLAYEAICFVQRIFNDYSSRGYLNDAEYYNALERVSEDLFAMIYFKFYDGETIGIVQKNPEYLMDRRALFSSTFVMLRCVMSRVWKGRDTDYDLKMADARSNKQYVMGSSQGGK